MNIAKHIGCFGDDNELVEVLIGAITPGGNMSDSSEEEENENVATDAEIAPVDDFGVKTEKRKISNQINLKHSRKTILTVIPSIVTEWMDQN